MNVKGINQSFLYLYFVAIILLVTLMGCKDQGIPKERPNIGISKIEQLSLHKHELAQRGRFVPVPATSIRRDTDSVIWYTEQIAKAEFESGGAVFNFFIYQSKVIAAPPQYQGPLAYISGRVQVASGRNEMVELFYDFGDWRNEFVYSDVMSFVHGVADGARTTDRSGKILAEAKVTRKIPNQGIEVEEFHYAGNGKIKFYCKSEFGFGSGHKKSQREQEGKEDTDYYFIWPTSAIF